MHSTSAFSLEYSSSVGSLFATSIHGRVAVTRVTVHIVDTVAISACIGLTVINVLGYLSPVIAFLAPLLGMIELIPMLEFGTSEPI